MEELSPAAIWETVVNDAVRGDYFMSAVGMVMLIMSVVIYVVLSPFMLLAFIIGHSCAIENPHLTGDKSMRSKR